MSPSTGVMLAFAIPTVLAGSLTAFFLGRRDRNAVSRILPLTISLIFAWISGAIWELHPVRSPGGDRAGLICESISFIAFFFQVVIWLSWWLREPSEEPKDENG